jgi:transposase-like protein
MDDINAPLTSCPGCESPDIEHTMNAGGEHRFTCHGCGQDYGIPFSEGFCVDCELYECDCEQED